LPYAAAIARGHQARLTVLHVVPTFEGISMPSGRIDAAHDIVNAPTPDDVRHEMRRAVQEVPLQGLEVRFSTQAGDPVQVIADQAVSDSADLIVMGTHGRSGFERLLIGSVTEKVLRLAPCPVLAVPPHVSTPVAVEAVYSRVLSPASLRAADPRSSSPDWPRPTSPSSMCARSGMSLASTRTPAKSVDGRWTPPGTDCTRFLPTSQERRAASRR